MIDMKRFLLTLMLFLTLSCGVIRQKNSSDEMCTRCVPVEVYRDTIDVEGLARTCKAHNLHPSMDEWSLMRYYNTIDDVLNQYVYTSGKTTYTISNYNDGQYIFTISVDKPIE